MKKKIITVFLIAASIVFISPMNTMALESNNISIIEKSESNILTNTVTIAAGEPVLGDVNDEDSVAWLVQLVLNIVKVVGPILVILLSSVDFIMVIIKSDNEQFQKAQKRLITRLILALLLFLVPVIVEILLQIFGFTGNATAGIR